MMLWMDSAWTVHLLGQRTDARSASSRQGLLEALKDSISDDFQPQAYFFLNLAGDQPPNLDSSLLICMLLLLPRMPCETVVAKVIGKFFWCSFVVSQWSVDKNTKLHPRHILSKKARNTYNNILSHNWWWRMSHTQCCTFLPHAMWSCTIWAEEP